ncbi:MAG: response regulator [Nitrospirae bacterium]|nr:MAG: response regulator [Nitrospirota bacterium]
MALILVIDDSLYMRGKICSILKLDGHKIIEADNGLQGLQAASANSPDCILLDIIMPGLDGLKIIKSLRDQRVDTPMIVVTADIQESTRKQCMELGASAVINKPPNEEELRRTINAILADKKETGR